MGMGRCVGKDQFLDWKDPKPLKINSIEVCPPPPLIVPTSFIYLYWVSVEVLTVFLVGMNGVAFNIDHVAVLRSTGLSPSQDPASCI